MKKFFRDKTPLVILWLVRLLHYKVTGLFVDRSLKCSLHKVDCELPAKVVDWIERESALYEAETGLDLDFGSKWLPLAKLLHLEMLLKIRYCPDIENYEKKEYWATSEEVKARGKDDCDGQAAYMYHLLRTNGFPESHIGLTRCVTEKGTGHVFCCIFHKEHDFYVLDNGAITPCVELASNCLGRIKEFRESFTMNSKWRWECE